MRNTLFYIFFTIVCAVSCHSCATSGTSISPDAVEDHIVAVVNGSSITYAEFKQELDN